MYDILICIGDEYHCMYADTKAKAISTAKAQSRKMTAPKWWVRVISGTSVLWEDGTRARLLR